MFLAKDLTKAHSELSSTSKDDPKWADILEQNSEVRSHPVEWLQHYQPAANSDHEVIQSPHTNLGSKRLSIGSPEVDWLQAEENLKNEGAKAAA